MNFYFWYVSVPVRSLTLPIVPSWETQTIASSFQKTFGFHITVTEEVILITKNNGIITFPKQRSSLKIRHRTSLVYKLNNHRKIICAIFAAAITLFFICNLTYY